MCMHALEWSKGAEVPNKDSFWIFIKVNSSHNMQHVIKEGEQSRKTGNCSFRVLKFRVLKSANLGLQFMSQECLSSP